MTLDERLAKLEQLTLQVEGFALIYQKDHQIGLHQQIAAACLEITIEHIRSVVILVRRFQYNTSFALMRVQNESLVRAIWWTHCGTADDIERLKIDKFTVDYKRMKSELEGLGKSKIYELIETIGRSKAMQHSFTHTGRDQIFRRLASSSRASIGGVLDEQRSEQLFGYNEALLLRVCTAYSELFSDHIFNMNISMVIEQFDCIRDTGITEPNLYQ